MTNIITYGTFDLFHFGHFELLYRAKNLKPNANLIVGISTDKFNEAKGKHSHYKYSKRALMVQSLNFVSKVIPENTWDQKIEDIKKQNIDIFVMGCDWRGRFDNLSKYCEVVYLSRTEAISTTVIKGLLTQDKNSSKT